METPILQVNSLNKHYGKLHALKDVSFQVYPGQIIGLLGHNGAGKSTLIKCLMGALKSYSGDILMAGQNIRGSHHVIREQAGFLLEPAFCDYLSAAKNLELLNSLSSEPDKKRVREVLELVSLGKFADKKVGDFSFGMRQRLGLAQVLLTRPKLIVLDEPTVGLDPLGVEIIKDIILQCSRAGVAVLFSSHQLSDVFEICHRAIVMNQGSVVYDGDAQRLTRKHYLITLGCDAGEHLEALRRVAPELEAEGATLRFADPAYIQPVLRCLLDRKAPIADIGCDTSMDRLKGLMH